jgi:hypothetical protein
MAGRIFRTVDCYPYDTPVNQPRIKITLYNTAKEPWPHREVLAPIDTGFSGAVMLPEQEYQFFLVSEFPRRFWKDYRTMTGPLQMRTARALIRTGASSALDETVVESPVLGMGKLLVGRMTLSKCRLLLDGPARSSCFMEG